MDATPTRLCKCGRPYQPKYPEQARCLRCRTLVLAQDRRRRDQPDTDALLKQLLRDEHDWQLKDPDHPGCLIWASDLAKLYRAQTRPRPVRNNLARWL